MLSLSLHRHVPPADRIAASLALHPSPDELEWAYERKEGRDALASPHTATKQPNTLVHPRAETDLRCGQQGGAGSWVLRMRQWPHNKMDLMFLFTALLPCSKGQQCTYFLCTVDRVQAQAFLWSPHGPVR